MMSWEVCPPFSVRTVRNMSGKQALGQEFKAVVVGTHKSYKYGLE
jgi:hypothetical protein